MRYLGVLTLIACCAGKSVRQMPALAQSLALVDQNVATFPEGADKSPPQYHQLSDNGVVLHAWSRDFARGSAVLLDFALPKANATPAPELKVDGRPIALSRSRNGYFALFANPPDSKRKVNQIELFQSGTKLASYELPVVQKEYPVSTQQLTVNKFSNQSKPLSPQTIAFIEESRQKKMKALVSTVENQLTGEFRYPRDEHKITSPFFVKRVYERFKIVKGKKKKLPGRVSFHGGTDLKGLTGAPIFAIADGIVNLADHLYYEGNIVIIDHGNGVISGYMHQSELLVKAGDRVKAGQLIGRTGDTGMVTGPHLHIFLFIHGVKTDPLSLLNLPVEPAVN